MKKGAFLIMMCMGFLGLFGACKTDVDKDKLTKKEKEQQKIIDDIVHPDSDVPAYEGFKNVVYESIARNSNGMAKYKCTFREKAVCKIGPTGSPAWCYMFPEYKIDNVVMLLDFSKQIEIKENITLQDIKNAYILELQEWLSTLSEELKKNNITEDMKKQIEKQIADTKVAIEDLKTNKRDEEFKSDVERIRNHAKKLATVNPIRVTISSDKKSLILEKYIDYDSVEYENMEFVTY